MLKLIPTVSCLALAGCLSSAALAVNIDASVKTLLSTQREDGYIGNYTDDL